MDAASRLSPTEVAHDLVTASDLEYTAFFRAEFASVLRTISLMLHDPGRAEEVTQDAFVQLLRHWPKVSQYDQPRAWVRRVAVRGAMRVIRRQRLISIVTLDVLTAPAPSSVTIDVSDALRRLSGSQRAAIVLHYFEDRTAAEIATILGCAEPTARVHLHRGRNRLRELLGEAGDGD
jgi:RNA polymerase sigma-70 factor (ECF subfamily)